MAKFNKMFLVKTIQKLIKKYPVLVQFSKFVVIGTFNTFLDFGILNLLMWLTGIYQGSRIFLLNSASFVIAGTNSYLWNKYWTFREKKGNIPLQFIKFLLVSVIGMTINGIIVYSITTFIPPLFNFSPALWANFAKVCATAIALMWNFTGYKFLVFKK